MDSKPNEGIELRNTLKDLEECEVLDKDISDRIVKIVGKERFLKALELLSLNGVKKYIFLPSKRTVWMSIGREHYYILYPDRFCGCVNFYNESIVKNRIYYCKHLLAQAILQKMKPNKFQKIEEELDDSQSFSIIADTDII